MRPYKDRRFLAKEHVYSKESVDLINKTLSFSGLELPQQIDYRAVGIYDVDYIHEIYTVPPKKDLPHIVMLHGFGGTALTYVRLFKSLSEFYQVHALDAFGVGHSSHGGFKEDFTYDQARDYFVDAIEEWRKKMQIKEFTLVGHSFGGYLAACYLEKHGSRVNRLMLLSPVGCSQKTPEQIQAEVDARAGQGLRGKIFMFFAEKFYNMKICPSKAMSSFWLGSKLLDRVVNERLKLKDQENETWRKYFLELGKRQASSEAGFYIIFEWPLKPKHTIEKMLERIECKIPIQFYYGNYDWMDSNGAQRMAQKYQNATFITINNAGHQLIFDNPEEISYHFISRAVKMEEEMSQKA